MDRILKTYQKSNIRDAKIPREAVVRSDTDRNPINIQEKVWLGNEMALVNYGNHLMFKLTGSHKF